MNLANRLTVLRILLVPVFVVCLLYFSPERPHLHTAAIVLYLAACVTDGLDGYLARKMNQKTDLGSFIDPLADKLLLLSGYLSLSLLPHLPEQMRMPGWVTLVVLSRDLVILIGSVVIFIATGALKPKPVFIGKITTVTQMAALLVFLLGLSWEVRMTACVLASVCTLLSGVVYIRIGGQLFQGA